MAAIKLRRHASEHKVRIVEQFRKFWLENHLCDVVLKSDDGTQYHAHAALLSASSMYFKKLLGGSFCEADQMRQKQPVEIDASTAALSALLDYIYDGEPEVNLETGIELLRRADAYEMPEFASAIETGIKESLDSTAALKVLQEAHGLYLLKDACEEKVAEDFEACSQHPDFGKLSLTQLGRILDRGDLQVSREETVLKCILNWLNISKDRTTSLGILLRLVDFKSFSVENLVRVCRFTISGPHCSDIHREADEALRHRKRERSPDSVRPGMKRRCLQHWSPDLGASSADPKRQVWQISEFPSAHCWHKDHFYWIGEGGRVFCQRLGDPGQSTVVSLDAGIVDSGGRLFNLKLSISPTGEVFVLNLAKRKLVSFRNGSKHLELDDVDADAAGLICSRGALYVQISPARESADRVIVQKLVDSTLQNVIAESLPSSMEAADIDMFVTDQEVLFVSVVRGNYFEILRINPAESVEPVVVGRLKVGDDPDAEESSFLSCLFVTGDETIYLATSGEITKVFTFYPGDTTAIEILESLYGPLVDLHVWDRSLYVVVEDMDKEAHLFYEYALPPKLQLQ